MRYLSTDFVRRQHRTNDTSSTQQHHQQPRRYRHPNLPPLFYAVTSRNWVTVLRRVQTHAHELLSAEYTSGDTPLHFACRFNAPLNVIRALERMKYTKNNEGATPLHVAASHRCSAAVISCLVSSSSSSFDADIILPLSLTKMGRAPLHYACLSFRGLDVGAFKILLKATIDACVVLDQQQSCPQKKMNDYLDWGTDVMDVAHQQANAFTMQDHSNQTPLTLLFRRYRERVKCVIHMLERHHRFNNTTPHNMKAAAAVREELGELWEKARLMVCLMAEKRLEKEKRDRDDEDGEEVDGGDVVLIETTNECKRRAAITAASAAVAREAAKWAKQQYQNSKMMENDNDDDLLLESMDDDVLLEHQDETSTLKTATTTLQEPKQCRRKFRLVHASVGLTGYGCPPEMIRLAASVYPHQVSEMDEDGNLPIHIAAEASSFLPSSTKHANGAGGSEEDDSLLSSFSNLSILSTTTTSSSSSSNSSCNFALEPNPFDTVIRMLLRIYPNAVKVPHGQTGYLPLIIAIQSKKRTLNDGIRALLESHPAALESMDVNTKLYPMILNLVGTPNTTHSTTKKKKKNRLIKNPLARLRKKNRNTTAVERNVPTALFELLKAKPALISKVALSSRNSDEDNDC